eukprot:CAMPEP_0185769930 /NCGR_PEP_ID=MMETSP1174-20130828/56662_1 /TAXON_ID=35687 /ORGANISM="Dictyocha speculum, Strain CCMP1381" /LENGTH=34 /DNA_ID= /DNA_START= /DNA_END= /DNA_ORIENTATION=
MASPSIDIPALTKVDGAGLLCKVTKNAHKEFLTT